MMVIVINTLVVALLCGLLSAVLGTLEHLVYTHLNLTKEKLAFNW